VTCHSDDPCARQMVLARKLRHPALLAAPDALTSAFLTRAPPAAFSLLRFLRTWRNGTLRTTGRVIRLHAGRKLHSSGCCYLALLKKLIFPSWHVTLLLLLLAKEGGEEGGTWASAGGRKGGGATEA